MRAGRFAALALWGLIVLPAGAEQDEVVAEAELPAGTGYSINWSRVAGGGGFAEGGNYSLHGTVGQHEVQAEPTPAGNNFGVRAGFWIVVRQTEPALIDLIFRDRFRSE